MDYPELYYRTYPKVLSTVNKYLETKQETEEITSEEMDNMIDQVYIEVVEQYPEIHEDQQERRLRSKRYKSQKRSFYGRSKILRDLISILLISELLRKNRTLYPI